MAAADAEAFGEDLHRGFLFVERAFGDELEGARHAARGAAPGSGVGSRLGPATQAGAKARALGGGCTDEEAAVLLPRRAGGADGPTIDAGRGDADEEAPVETRVARHERLITHVGIELGHGPARILLPRGCAGGFRTCSPAHAGPEILPKRPRRGTLALDAPP